MKRFCIAQRIEHYFQVSMPLGIVVRWIILCFLVMISASRGNSRSFGSAFLTYFPKQVKGLAYIDFTRVRSFNSYARIKSQFVPSSLSNLEQLLGDPSIGDAEVDEALWAFAPLPNQTLAKASPSEAGTRMMGLVFGHFDPETALRFLKDRNVPSETIDRYVAWPVVDFDHDPAYGPPPSDESTWFMFLDSNVVAFGSRPALRDMIGAHNGDQPDLSRDANMLAAIYAAEDNQALWGVFSNQQGQALIQHMIPKTVDLPAVSRVIGNMGAVQVSLDGSSWSSLEFNLRADLGSPSTARSVAQIVARAALQRAESKKTDNPELADVFAAAEVYSIRSQLAITVRISDDRLCQLLDRDSLRTLIND